MKMWYRILPIHLSALAFKKNGKYNINNRKIAYDH